jgi:hypothetical protein
MVLMVRSGKGANPASSQVSSMPSACRETSDSASFRARLFWQSYQSGIEMVKG